MTVVPPPAWSVHMPAGVAPDGVDLLRDHSLPGRWTRLWGERPSWPQLRDIEGTWLSSLELEARSASVARRLLAAGLGPGDRVVVSAATSAHMVIAYVGALRAGLVVVPINTAYTQGEVAGIVSDAQPRAAVVDDRGRGEWIAAAASHSVILTGVDVDLPEGDDVILDATTPDDPALLVYTSGTTGRPKGALLTHGNLLSSATAVGLAWRWQPDDVLLLTLPLFHLHGLGVGINGSLSSGASVVLRPRFDVADVVDQVSEVAPSLFFGVPTIYQRLVGAGAGTALSTVRLLVSGSAPLPPTVSMAVAEQAGQMPLERYGMTETVMLTSNPYEGPRRPGTVGLPFPGVEVRLATTGEVEVRGPNVIAGYYRRPDASAEAFTDDNWFRTGDLGEFDADGYLRLVGRSKDLIITGGYNVHPREVEEALLAHPGVREVAVVGRDSPDWGEEVVAVVVADGVVDVDDLRRHAGGRLAPYKVPKRIELVADLPRNALGKILRNELR